MVRPRVRPGHPDGAVWRWSRLEASCKLENPRRPAALYLEAQAPVELLDKAQLVTIEMDGAAVDLLRGGGHQRFLRKFPCRTTSCATSSSCR